MRSKARGLDGTFQRHIQKDCTEVVKFSFSVDYAPKEDTDLARNGPKFR
jgi:hypothetical protein